MCIVSLSTSWYCKYNTTEIYMYKMYIRTIFTVEFIWYLARCFNLKRAKNICLSIFTYLMSDRKYGGEIESNIVKHYQKLVFWERANTLTIKKNGKKGTNFSNSKVDYENVCREEYLRNVLTSKGKSSINKIINRFLLLGWQTTNLFRSSCQSLSDLFISLGVPIVRHSLPLQILRIKKYFPHYCLP